MNDFQTNRTSMALLTVALLGCGGENGTQGFTLGRAATLELSVGQSTIVPGSTISISSGNLLPGEEDALAAIRIINTGQADLTISEITLVSEPPDAFRLAADSDSYAPLSSGPYTIVPQSAEAGRPSLVAHVIVRRPARTVIPTGTIRVRSNSVSAGASQPELIYSLTLETSPPKLVALPGVVDLGEVPVGENRQATLAVDNRGGDMLIIDRVSLAGHEGFAVAFGPHNWSSAPASSEVVVDPPIEIRPGQQANAAVQYSARGAENATAQLILYSNDPSAPQGSIVALVANAGMPTTPIVAIDAPNGASGEVTCRLVTEATDTEPLTYSWHWQIGDATAFATFGPSLSPNEVKDCDRVRCWTEVTDGHGVISSNLAEAILPFGSDCDDQNVCTDDACGAQGGCAASDNAASCADSDRCNGAEQCAGGRCIAGGPVDCSNTLNPCLESTCNPATGLCDLPKADGTLCPDSDLCNGFEVCQSGSCKAGAVVDCSAVAEPCLEKACNPLTGTCDLRKVDDTPCTDGDLCNGAERCLAGACQSGTPVSCVGVQNPCLEQSCNPATGQCDLGRPDGTSCADGDLCNGFETCQSSQCLPGLAVDCSGVTNPCLEKTCSPVSGGCTLAKPDGTSCSDSDLCNGMETCEGGQCQSGDSLECDDSNTCTTDSCSASFGCVYTGSGNVGNSPDCPALSCDEIKALAPSSGDGLYWLSPDDGAAVQAYCDMTYDGGGWTRVLGFVISDDVSRSPPGYEIRPGLEAAAQDVGHVRSDYVGDLMELVGASEIRFLCLKSSVATRIHITTSNVDVVSYLTGRSDVRPIGPGTFTRSADPVTPDTSFLTQHPADWGGVSKPGVWGSDNPTTGEQRLWDHPFYIHVQNHWLLANNRSECDDTALANFGRNGSWRIYVR